MSEHYTCDRCGMPMESRTTMLIEHTEFDLCESCKTRIYDGLNWVSCNITLKRGLVGAKPEAFCFWLFEVLNLTPEDEFHDLFPGTGAVTEAWHAWCRQRTLSYA